MMMLFGRHDILQNDIRQNDIYQNDIQKNSAYYVTLNLFN
jgi:hypothetical protein